MQQLRAKHNIASRNANTCMRGLLDMEMLQKASDEIIYLFQQK